MTTAIKGYALDELAISHASAFSPNYKTAKSRFCSSVTFLQKHYANSRIRCELESHSINQQGPDGEELTIDVAILGAVNPKRVVILSSGLHGVEGFFGSAVQVALLEEHLKNWSFPSDAAVILIHCLNPYGFAWLRRCNEDNVDLNRNFLLPGEEFQGSPEQYPKLDAFFNPTSPPSRFEPFLLQAIALILRYGMTALKNTIPVGQYDFPKGLFFGGHYPSKTQNILAAHLKRWVGEATNILHIDLHTGLGRKSTYKLLSQELPNSSRTQWLIDKFGADVVSIFEPKSNVYPIRGSLETWCKAMFPQSSYDFLTAEFGTYNNIKVVEALRLENRVYWWGHNHPSYARAKQRLVEVFAPVEQHWRETVLFQGLDLVQQAFKVCFEG